MGKIPRKTKTGRYTKKYLDHIKMKDFQGQLSPEEIEVAKANGLHRWNLWKLASRSVTLTMKQHQAGLRVAPVFDGSDRPDSKRYTKKTKFIIRNYDELAAKTTI